MFFQPVGGRFVDGGVVSNLPAFALSRAHRHGFEKVLCFTFSPSTTPILANSTQQDPEQYLLRLISTIIDGSVSIQSSLQDDLHVIEIGELPLGTLDFASINRESAASMIQAGAAAARRFFDSEPIRLQTDGNTRPILRTEPQTLNQVVREEGGAFDEMWLLLARTRYVYNLFPTLLHWRMNGARLTVVTVGVSLSNRTPEASHERFRRLVLKCLGVRIFEVESLPFEGFFFRRNGGPGNAVVLDNSRTEHPLANFAVKYDSQHDLVAVSSMFGNVTQIAEKLESRTPVPRMQLGRGDLDVLTERLKMIQQYRDRQVSITFEEVDVDRIVFLTRYVKSYKYGQVSRLFDIYNANRFELFESVQLQYTWANVTITMPVTPPVAEEHDGRLFLLEGNSRLTYLIKEQRARRVFMIVVRNVSARLPASGQFGANQVLISDESRIGSERYEGWDRADYRPIEETVRAPHLYEIDV